MSAPMKTADITFSDVSASNLTDADRDWFGTSDQTDSYAIAYASPCSVRVPRERDGRQWPSTQQRGLAARARRADPVGM